MKKLKDPKIRNFRTRFESAVLTKDFWEKKKGRKKNTHVNFDTKTLPRTFFLTFFLFRQFTKCKTDFDVESFGFEYMKVKYKLLNNTLSQRPGALSPKKEAVASSTIFSTKSYFLQRVSRNEV